MDPSTTPLIGFYLTIVILALMVAYAGFEGTMRVFSYLDLQIRYAFVRLQMFYMGWNLKRQLIKDTKNYERFIEETKNDQR